MAIEQNALMQQRRLVSGVVPDALSDGQLSYVSDTGDLLIGTPSQDNVANRTSYPFKNTRILTEWSQSIEGLLNYRFRLRGSGVQNSTGYAHPITLTGKPIIRYLQERLDEFVSVLSYGATGNGSTDDTYAIRLAAIDVMSAESPNYGKALYFPAGQYLISNSMLLPPGSRWIGDGKKNSIIYTTTNIDAMVETCDSGLTVSMLSDPSTYGMHIRQNIGSDPTKTFPNNISISGISFSHEGSTNSTFRVVVLLIRGSDIQFSDCAFGGTFICGTKTDNSPYTAPSDIVGVIADSLSLPDTISNIKFTNCLFQNLSYGVVLTDNLKSVSISHSYANNLYRFLSVGELVSGSPPLTRQYPISSILVTAHGTGYSTAPSVLVNSGTGTGNVSIASIGANSISGYPAGSGYVVGDSISISGGTLSSFSGAVAFSGIVTQINGSGGITGISIINSGNYSAAPSNPATVTGGTGTGATITIDYGVSDIEITNSGSGYVSTDTVVISGGSGSGATASIQYLDGPRGIHLTDNYFNDIQNSAVVASASYAIPSNIVSMMNFYDSVGFGITDCVNQVTRAYTVINFGSGVKNCAVVLDAFSRQGSADTTNVPVSSPRIEYNVNDNHFILSLQDGSFVQSGGGGSITYKTITANYNISLSESPTQYDNIGASGDININLPVAQRGLEFSFVVAEPYSITVVASAGCTISIGTSTSAVAGNVISSDIYSSITLRAISSTEWVATGSEGNWDVN